MNASIASSDCNVRQHRKCIVFLDSLLALFNICHHCREKNPLVAVSQVATMIQVITTCASCGNEFRWQSQPRMPKMKAHAGNFLLSMAILLAGGSFNKTKHIFSIMGLQCVSMAALYRYQKVCMSLNFTALYPILHNILNISCA